MEILGKQVSQKTAENISRIESQLQKQVIYQFTDKAKTRSYGQCDPWQEDAYYVYCKSDLLSVTRKKDINIPFETNILHELSHLCQIEEGYPHTGTLQIPQTASDPSFYDSLGDFIGSSVLDLNVDNRLKQMGYTSIYFYTQRFIRFEKLARRGYTCKSDVEFLRMAIGLISMNLSFPGENMSNLLRLYEPKNPGLVACVKELSTGISDIGYNDADSTFCSLVFLFSAFNLWSTHAIGYHEKWYSSVHSVRVDYPDIHILE